MKSFIACFIVLLMLVFSQNVFSENTPIKLYAVNDVGPYSSSWGDVILGSYGNVIKMKGTNIGVVVRDSNFNWSAPNKLVYEGNHWYPYGTSKSTIFKIGKDEFLLKTVAEDFRQRTNEIITTSSLCHFYANEIELIKVINSWPSKEIVRIEFVID